MNEIISQIIGLIGAILMISSVLVKDKKRLYLALNGLAGLFFAASVGILGGYSGAFTNTIGAIIAFVVYFCESKSRPITKPILAAFTIVTILGIIFTYTDIYSLIPLIAGLLYIVIVLSKDMKNIRLLSIVQGVIWICYDIIIGSYTPILSSCFAIISAIIGLVAFDFKKKP